LLDFARRYVQGDADAVQTLSPDKGQGAIEGLAKKSATSIFAEIDSDAVRAVFKGLAEAGVALEVCPGSNVALGVYPSLADVPLRQITDAGIPVALGADDPLLFGSRLTDQYAAARGLGLNDAELAQLARDSFLASRAPAAVREAASRDIDEWLARAAEQLPARA
jgi:adenosine deaminase